LCVFSWAKNLVLDRAAPTTWGVFTASGLVSVVLSAIAKIKNMAYVIRTNAGRVVFVCDVGGSGGGVENDFVPFIDSGSSA
jgi:hypothetical protein